MSVDGVFNDFEQHFLAVSGSHFKSCQQLSHEACKHHVSPWDPDGRVNFVQHSFVGSDEYSELVGFVERQVQRLRSV